jgi:uncharacterized protein YutE (UPF0331/DUF86 family)
MTLRPEIIRERLRKIRAVVRNFSDLADIPGPEFQTSFRHYWTAERGLQLAAESLFDVGVHILAGQFNDHPDDLQSAWHPADGNRQQTTIADEDRARQFCRE